MKNTKLYFNSIQYNIFTACSAQNKESFSSKDEKLRWQFPLTLLRSM